MSDVYLDATKFIKKLKKIKSELPVFLHEQLNESRDIVFREVMNNLSGPAIGMKPSPGAPGIGEMPVPRRSGNLARSLKSTPANDFKVFIFCDEDIAEDYPQHVHDGTKNIPARPFLKEPFVLNEKKIINKINSQVNIFLRHKT